MARAPTETPAAPAVTGGEVGAGVVLFPVGLVTTEVTQSVAGLEGAAEVAGLLGAALEGAAELGAAELGAALEGAAELGAALEGAGRFLQTLEAASMTLAVGGLLVVVHMICNDNHHYDHYNYSESEWNNLQISGQAVITQPAAST